MTVRELIAWLETWDKSLNIKDKELWNTLSEEHGIVIEIQEESK